MKYILHHIIAIGVFLGFIFPVTAYTKSISLLDVRTSGESKNTRIVLEFSKPVQYKVFTLKNPYRIVIDTSDFSSKLAPQMSVKKFNAVNTIRYGTFRPNVGRTVMDLRYPVTVKKVFILKGQSSRLVIDLQRSSISEMSKQDTLKSSGWDNIDGISKQKQKQQLAKMSKPPKRKKTKPLIVIDAGHGGPDPGSIGVGGIYEKRITLSMSKIIAARLKKSGKFDVVLTRDKDIYIPLRTRYKIAEDRNADFFISVHADKHPRSSVRGMSVYTLSEKSSDKEAARLARKENQFDLLVGEQTPVENDILNILIDVTQSNTMNASALFAKNLVKSASQAKIKTLRRPHRFAGFAVLKSPKVPSVLIELGYMSNRSDIYNLRNNRWKKSFANTVYNSLIKYFKNNPIDSR